MPQALSDAEIVNRIKIMDSWLKKPRDLDASASEVYIDANAPQVGSTEDWTLAEDLFDSEVDVPDPVPIGQPNWSTINTEIKISSTAMSCPKLHVVLTANAQVEGVPDPAKLVARCWEEYWGRYGWNQECRDALQKKSISGLGVVWHRWDTKRGPCFEHVPLKRLLLDPHASNLRTMDYAGVKVKIPLRKAIETYPKWEALLGKVDVPLFNGEDVKHLDNVAVTVTIYFDDRIVAHVFRDKVIYRSDNLYGGIPFHFLRGFTDPRGRLLPLGDSVMAAGLNQAVVDVTSLIINMAKNGGQVTLYDTNAFTPAGTKAIEEGQQQQWIPVNIPLNAQALPVHRISAEQPSPAYGEARRELQQALDGVQGVTAAQRGEQVPNVTATQSMLSERRGGARPTEERAMYEIFVSELANSFVYMMQKFGGPTEEDPGNEEMSKLWECFMAVQEVSIIDGSTSYMNPAADQQGCMQLYTAMVQTLETWMALANLGATDVIPNLQRYADDTLRAFSRSNTEDYWIKAPQPKQNGPSDKLISALSSVYKVAPPDVRRQIEQDFGLSPSQLGEPEDNSSAVSEASKGAEAAASREHEEYMQNRQHTHELTMKSMDQISKASDRESSERMIKDRALGSKQKGGK